MQLQVGTTLTVTPQVAGGVDGAEILLKLNPVVSSVDGTDALTGLPFLALRNVETTVRVRPD